VTSLLTAVYMFRAVFLAFHGPSRTTSPGEHQAPHPTLEHSAPEHPAQRHPAPGTHLHDAPPAMAIALIVLAIGSVVAGYVGPSFERFLEPSFGVPVVELDAEAHEVELTLMVVSTLVAAAGIGLAVFFFLKNRAAADRIAAQLPGPRRVLENKYYVDEIYDAAVVQPVRIVSERGLWRIVDVRLIDGAVNGVGGVMQRSGDVLRRLQTGSVRAYAASLFFGVVMILGYYLWR
jgi:NADH-quinone oxidoreductase subunit L